MSSEGTTGELDGNVVRGIAPPFEVLAVGSSDKLFKLVVRVPVQVLGRVDIELSEQIVEFVGQRCDARVATDLPADAADDEAQTLGAA